MEVLSIGPLGDVLNEMLRQARLYGNCAGFASEKCRVVGAFSAALGLHDIGHFEEDFCGVSGIISTSTNQNHLGVACRSLLWRPAGMGDGCSQPSSRPWLQGPCGFFVRAST